MAAAFIVRAATDDRFNTVLRLLVDRGATVTADGPRRLLVTGINTVELASSLALSELAEIIEPHTTPFDADHHAYATALIDVGDDGRYKFVTTPDDWCPSWAIDTTSAAHALVTMREVHLPGRSDAPTGTYRVAICGADDTCCVADVVGRDLAVAVFDWVRDGITVHQALTAGFRYE